MRKEMYFYNLSFRSFCRTRYKYTAFDIFSATCRHYFTMGINLFFIIVTKHEWFPSSVDLWGFLNISFADGFISASHVYWELCVCWALGRRRWGEVDVLSVLMGFINSQGKADVSHNVPQILVKSQWELAVGGSPWEGHMARAFWLCQFAPGHFGPNAAHVPRRPSLWRLWRWVHVALSVFHRVWSFLFSLCVYLALFSSSDLSGEKSP